MIKLTRLDGKPIWFPKDFCFSECLPGLSPSGGACTSVWYLGQMFMVKETPEDILALWRTAA